MELNLGRAHTSVLDFLVCKCALTAVPSSHIEIRLMAESECKESDFEAPNGSESEEGAGYSDSAPLLPKMKPSREREE